MKNLLSCHYNMDTNRVEAQFEDGSTIGIDCIAVEDEYGDTPVQRAENWTGCFTISRWSMRRWFWKGRWSIICHLGVTMVDWKIEL